MTGSTPTDEEMQRADRYINSCVGNWRLGDEVFKVTKSPEGGLMAFAADGREVPAGLILMDGRKIS
jgi:hypothetical protein